MSLQVGSPAPAFEACHPTTFAKVRIDPSKKTVLSFFPAAFSGGPDAGCEMQLCSMNHVASQAPDAVFYGVSGDLPFANAAFAKHISISFPLLCDPSLDSCRRYVGLCPLGNYLKDAGVGDGLVGTETTARGCVIVENGNVLYAFSGGNDPGAQPDLATVRKVLGIN